LRSRLLCARLVTDVSRLVARRLILRRQAGAAATFQHGEEAEAAADRHADRRARLAAAAVAEEGGKT
jgi:hypothetical protein